MPRNKSVRLSPSGNRVSVSWDGKTVASNVSGVHFVGGSYGRAFQIAPAGAHDFAAENLLDAQLVERVKVRGKEIRISTARDGSSTIASYIGNHHELMTVFHGPAPATRMITELFAVLDIKDNANGMTVTPQGATGLTATGEHVFLQMEDSASVDIPTPDHARQLLPKRAGQKTKHGEVWKTLLPGRSGKKVHDYSYLVGTPTGVAEVVFADDTVIGEDAAMEFIDGLDVSWG